jgi:hypothetical protein
MATTSTEVPQFRRAIQACTVALRRVDDCELDPSLHRGMQELGERKCHASDRRLPRHQFS